MAWLPVKESKRTYIFVTGYKLSIHNVTSLNLDETWIRTKSDEGLLMVNPANLAGILVADSEADRTINKPPRK
jgi:hypothetical protein